MATYCKEKNVITITLDNSNGSYRLDINTGIFYGIKGSPIKTCPRRNEICSLLYPHLRTGSNNLVCIIYSMISNYSNTSAYAHFANVMQSADKVDALGFPSLHLNKDQYLYLGENIKALSLWAKNNNKSDFNFREFIRWCEFEEAKKNLGAVADLLTPDMYYAITSNCSNPTTEEIGVCAYYLSLIHI